MCCAMLSCLVLSKSLRPHELKPARLLCPWGFSIVWLSALEGSSSELTLDKFSFTSMETKAQRKRMIYLKWLSEFADLGHESRASAPKVGTSISIWPMTGLTVSVNSELINILDKSFITSIIYDKMKLHIVITHNYNMTSFLPRWFKVW